MKRCHVVLLEPICDTPRPLLLSPFDFQSICFHSPFLIRRMQSLSVAGVGSRVLSRKNLNQIGRRGESRVSMGGDPYIPPDPPIGDRYITDPRDGAGVVQGQWHGRTSNTSPYRYPHRSRYLDPSMGLPNCGKWLRLGNEGVLRIVLLGYYTSDNLRDVIHGETHPPLRVPLLSPPQRAFQRPGAQAPSLRNRQLGIGGHPLRASPASSIFL